MLADAPARSHEWCPENDRFFLRHRLLRLVNLRVTLAPRTVICIGQDRRYRSDQGVTRNVYPVSQGVSAGL